MIDAVMNIKPVPGLSDSTIEIRNKLAECLLYLYMPLLLLLIVRLGASIASTIYFGLIKKIFDILPCCIANKKKNNVDVDDDIAIVPRVNVIVPAYNEEVGIAKTMDSIINNKYPNMKLIVVNDGSTDRTDEKICEYIKQYSSKKAASSKTFDMDRSKETKLVFDLDASCVLSTDSTSKSAEEENSSLSSSGKPRESLLDIEEGTVEIKGTEKVLSSAATPPRIRAEIEYIKLENGGKANAMNTAFQHIDGEFVVTIDADSIIDKKAIQRIIDCFLEDEKIGSVAGNVVVANRSRPIGLTQQAEYLSGFFFKRGDAVFNAVYIVGGAAAAYRRTVLEQVGKYFDKDIITEDIELSTRILANGFKTKFVPNAVVYTEGPSDWMGLCNQRLRWKYGRLLTLWKHRSVLFSTKQNPYVSMFLFPLTIYSEFLLLMEPIVIITYLIYAVFVSCGAFLILLVVLTAYLLFIILVDKKRKFHLNLVPICFMFFPFVMAIEAVEFQALIRSIRRLVKGEGLKWQKWKRVGLRDEDLEMEDEDE